MKSCSTCAHITRQWSEHPCATCSQGEERGNWEADTRSAMIDQAARLVSANMSSGLYGRGGPLYAPDRADTPATSAPAGVELRTGDGLARKIRRRAIAREWSTYLGRKIRARDVRIMQGLADDVEGGE